MSQTKKKLIVEFKGRVVAVNDENAEITIYEKGINEKREKTKRRVAKHTKTQYWLFQSPHCFVCHFFFHIPCKQVPYTTGCIN